MKTKILSITAIAMLLLGMFAVLPVYAVSPEIYLVPSNNFYDTDTAYVGMTFQVTVWVKDAVSIGGAQIYMEFNDNMVNVTSWAEPADAQYIFFGRSTSALPTPPDAGYTHVGPGLAYVMVSVSLFPPTPPYFSGTGKICVFTMQVLALPPKLGELSCTLNINDEFNTYLLDGDTGSPIAGVIRTNGAYKVTWKAPPSPNMGLNLPNVDPPDKNSNPLILQFDKYPPTVLGYSFDCGVLIKGLSAAWYLNVTSFRLTYNASVISIVGGVANVTVNPLWTSSSVTVTEDSDPAVLDYIDVSVDSPSSNPSGNVLVVTIKFTVMKQEVAPPAPPDYVDWTYLEFSDEFFYDHIGPIPAGVSEKGEVDVPAMQILKHPWLEVVPALVELGPEPSIGEEFEVGVKITGPPPDKLHKSWKLIGIQFRLLYDPELLDVVSVTEGPFLQNPTWNTHGTFFIGSIEIDGLGPHVAVGNMLLPNGTGDYDQTTFPNGEGIFAYIRFKAIKQECPDPLECPLELIGLFDDEWALDMNGNWIPCDPPVNGLYRILPFSQPGRDIDLYGGAKNDGYWTGYPDPFPTPYGGQGPDHWMDLVFPQSEVTLYAYVTYNWYPVQSKDVGFEIEGPYEKLPNGTLVPMQRYQIWAKFTATTDEDGIATLVYRMPWPCEDPDGITGVWKITATTTLADEIIIDTMIFYYERVVHITKVSTDTFYYIHGEYVEVTVEYETHAVQLYPILFAIVLTDDLGVPFGMALYAGTIGGATFCTWKPGEFSVSIYIPKWAYAGYGLVHVSAYDKDPTDGGEPYCPEYSPVEFQIGPY